MCIIITGFEPFNNEATNPTQELVRKLQVTAPGDGNLVTDVLPVDTIAAPAYLTALLDRHHPTAVLLMGLAMGRAVLSVERVAINVRDFNIPDNAGVQLHDQPIVPDGPAAYFSTIPVCAIRERLCANGIPAEISNSAGTYLCNQVLYTALHWAAQREQKPSIGFLHTPPLPGQVAAQQRPGPSMAFETMLTGVRIILDILNAPEY